ncbi:hypothetical protein JQ582_37330 [Bradyrhizobium japonicum]|jgi:hypothetical protein|uniref:hypothetical protein n=1 Tax=Bradyrhizobium TaxID=374 RepID=UPI00057FECC3|nr:hypothetical protein [Bradyrhizobium japonicum]MBR0734865.1 hypothetical protein [Bradyrhizobium japonicum]MBR0749599.1 hypothetical protein [Bradyrhizobium japonicum]MCD9112229.1 hypothetical protein [Bradyrhizobium japonicum]MCD9258278.1 hypothetical protein [Bradyrhizobium japonicum SEMIA 5079]MCD9824468.1 hypothetical protein [Bradyrhizobium japonicum]
MKKIAMASACIFALATTGAYAQSNQPAPGASGQGEVGPSSAGKKKITTGASSTKNQAGDSMGRQPTGGGSNTNNMGSQAGGGAGGAGGSGGK